jgi:hypothetical protein
MQYIGFIAMFVFYIIIYAQVGGGGRLHIITHPPITLHIYQPRTSDDHQPHICLTWWKAEVIHTIVNLLQD